MTGERAQWQYTTLCWMPLHGPMGAATVCCGSGPVAGRWDGLHSGYEGAEEVNGGGEEQRGQSSQRRSRHVSQAITTGSCPPSIAAVPNPAQCVQI